jgi:flagellin
MTALKTLQQTNKGLETTQGRISTGLRVAQASDNAAYWSIATTMRSDNSAMSTVKDALGLGAAQVDVAYTAMDSVKNYLDQIKSKLVAASQPGVDKSKIQSEISQLQDSLKSISDSANFSGSNWLSVDSKSAGYNATQKIVASFTRGEGNAISLGTIDVDVSKLALFDKGGAGLLQKAEGIDNTSILAETGTSGVTNAGGAVTQATQTIGATLDTTGGFTFDVVIGGVTQNVNLGALNAAATTAADVAAAINTQINNGTLTGVSVAVNGNNIEWTVQGQGAEHSLSIANAQINGAASAAQNATGADVNSAATATLNGSFSATTLDADDSISFTLDLDGTKHDIKIDKATVDAALSVTTGAIGTQADFVTVLNKALGNANITGTVASVVGGKVTLTGTATDATAKVEISGLRHSSGSAAFDVLEMDISKATTDQLAAFTQGIDDMISAVTTAASDLGAVKSRIGMQQDFVKNLMDAVDRGVGALVDANMNEESTRLQALQVQQQLGIQALSIANGSAQQILSLFRG